MTQDDFRVRLMESLDEVPDIKNILLSSDSLEEKRRKIRLVLSEILVQGYDRNPDLPEMKWILIQDVITTLWHILTTRAEKLSGYSLLQYLDDLVNKENLEGVTPPSPGFIAEIDHFMKGIAGKANIYDDEEATFSDHEGREAAELRSEELSKIGMYVQKYLKRYPTGLDDDVRRERIENRNRILKYFGASEIDWNHWKWHTRNIISGVKTLSELVKLSDEEYEAVKLARENKIPFGITPYYLSLMDYESDGGTDSAVRAQVIPPLHYVHKVLEGKADANCSMDFMLEKDTSPFDGITRRYPRILILKPVLTCPQICVYCQRNWEIEDVYSKDAIVTKSKVDAAIDWIDNTPSINEVLITGGDPLLLSNERIDHIMSRLSQIDHIERIRIGTRTPVTLPMRITDGFIKNLHRYHVPGRREVMIVTHFEHPYEITPEAMEAVQKFRRLGMDVYNQLVYTFFVSRRFEAAALRHSLRLIGVSPYYTFNTKGKEETDDYRVPIARLMQEQKEEARVMPGSERTDEIVFNVPRLGKNYLRAWQHHHLLSVLPNGRRVYEFHPWEKYLSLVDTYVYEDISIHDYLEKLTDAGEKIEDYKTIWYYY